MVALTNTCSHNRPGTVDRLDETSLRELFRTPPPEFVAARNEVVKRLRREKDRESATAVAALRRPSWSDWALNMLAGERAEAVDAFATAAEAVRDAQQAAIEGRSGADVRSALQELRAATAPLVREADAVLRDRGREDGSAEVAGRLSELAGLAPAVDQLRRGVLGSADPGASDPFAGLEPAPVAARPAKRKPSPRAAKAPPDGPSKSERRRLERAAETAAAEHERSRRASAKAEAAVDAARRSVAEAERRLQAAEEQLEAAAETERRAEEAREAAQQAIEEASPSPA